MKKPLLTAKQLSFGKMVAMGTAPIDAYQQVYGVSRESAMRGAYNLMRSPKMAKFRDEMLENTREEVLPIRAEVRDFLLSTMRDGEVAMEHRLRAAKQLCELEGFDKRQVSAADEAEIKWRTALIAEMRREPLVKEMGQVKAIDV